MNRVSTPQSRCSAGFATADITPPVGIYHRMWGAAKQDLSTSIHRPLCASVLYLESLERSEQNSPALMIVSLDFCILDQEELDGISAAITAQSGVPASQIQITLTHTHGSGRMSRERSHLPGGELIGPYLDSVWETVGQLARSAQEAATPSILTYGTGRCQLAGQRDYYDRQRDTFVCGFNPKGFADDTVLVGRVTAQSDERTIAILVNYACHPTTLAWDNFAISPDWVGSLRETVQNLSGAPCLFLQGASGDLGPRDGFVGDLEVAERNGRQLAYATLATLEALPPPATEYHYAGPVVSGALIGTWEHRPVTETLAKSHEVWRHQTFSVALAYRHDLPTLEHTLSDRQKWASDQATAEARGDEALARDCRAKVEQMDRQITRLKTLAAGKFFPFEVNLLRLGDALWIFVPGELYQLFQTALRLRLAPHPVVVTTLSNGWNPGYLPTAQAYGYGIYQEIISALAPGSLEVLIEAVARVAQKECSAG